MKKTWIIQVFFVCLQSNKTPKVMNSSTKEKIKEAIEDYCEGIEFLEFSRANFDTMINDIERIVEAERRSDAGWEAEFRGERNFFKGDME